MSLEILWGSVNSPWAWSASPGGTFLLPRPPRVPWDALLFGRGNENVASAADVRRL